MRISDRSSDVCSSDLAGTVTIGATIIAGTATTTVVGTAIAAIVATGAATGGMTAATTGGITARRTAAITACRAIIRRTATIATRDSASASPWGRSSTASATGSTTPDRKSTGLNSSH